MKKNPKKEGEKVSDNFMKKRLISHKKLAQERTLLASERNFLAYTRTGLASFALGFGLVKLFEESILYIYVGYLALIAGLGFILFGIFSHPKRKKRFMKY